jgi:hypothetical protein
MTAVVAQYQGLSHVLEGGVVLSHVAAVVCDVHQRRGVGWVILERDTNRHTGETGGTRKHWEALQTLPYAFSLMPRACWK